MEIELKLLVDPGDTKPIVAAVSAMAAGPGQRRLLTSIYFDTPELDLRRRRIALRVRRVAGRWVQTLKTEGSAGAGLTRRPEWESIVSGPRPDVAAFETAQCRKLLPLSLEHRLVPVFETRFWRTTWMVAPQPDSLVEVCLDRGEIRAADRRAPLCEVELELRSGPVDLLFCLAADLLGVAAFRVGALSKAERGYRMFKEEPALPVKAVAVSLDAAAGTGAAARTVGNAALAQLAANADLIDQADTEFLHQARVAVRRLRAAISLGRGVLDPGLTTRVVGDLRWLMDALGPGRDWDVFVDETLASLGPDVRATPGFAELRRRGEARRQQIRQTAVAAVRDRRFTVMLLDAGRLFESAADLADTGVRDFAVGVLDRRAKRLRRLGRDLLRCSPEERHAVRIAAKKLRYAADALAGLFPAGRAKVFLRAVAALQNVLGAQNDAVVCARFLGEIVPAEVGGPELRIAGQVEGWMAATAATRLTKLESAWGEFQKARPFWR